jgi:subtilisin
MTTSLDETIAAAGYAKVIVALKPQAVAAGVAAAALASGVSAALPRVDRDATERTLQNHFIIPSQSQADMLAAMSMRAASKKLKRADASPARVHVYPRLGLAVGFVDASGADALRRHPQVERIEKAPELSLIRPVDMRPSQAKVDVTWGIQRIKADRLWAAGHTGKGVVVGHLDTGVDGSHPDLKGAIAAFAEFDMAGNQVPGAKPWDSDEHGTHTAGTIVGRHGKKGSFGVAPEAQLASGMVIEGGQVVDRILAGMEWLVEQRVHILSMSLGLRGFTPAFQTVIDALRAAGISPVIAVGNEGAETSRSPGNYANVLSVGAMDNSEHVADFSGSQQFRRPDNPLVPDLVAPGVAVLSCIPKGKYAEMDGSSMATPHLAGLAALLLGAKPDATIAQLEQAIRGSCQRPANMPQPRANRGVPDAVKAFELLTGSTLPAGVSVRLPTRRRPEKVAARRARKRPVIRKIAAGRERRRGKRGA